jgi:hypothetical protein
MYGPYVLAKFPARKHNTTILDIEIIRNERTERLAGRRWIVPAAALTATILLLDRNSPGNLIARGFRRQRQSRQRCSPHYERS